MRKIALFAAAVAVLVLIGVDAAPTKHLSGSPSNAQKDD
jgi:hypothetical protein